MISNFLNTFEACSLGQRLVAEWSPIRVAEVQRNLVLVSPGVALVASFVAHVILSLESACHACLPGHSSVSFSRSHGMDLGSLGVP